MKLIKETAPRKCSKGLRQRWGLFICDLCGIEIEKRMDTGLIQKSCGCIISGFKHGGRHSRLYGIRYGMIQRCNSRKSIQYHNYGGRGIKVCDEWLESFEKFRDWAMENGYEENLELDRSDNNKDYTPSNCRWVTNDINIQNSRLAKLTKNDVIKIRDLYKSGSMIQREIGEMFGVDQSNISYIVNKKSWSKH